MTTTRSTDAAGGVPSVSYAYTQSLSQGQKDQVLSNLSLPSSAFPYTLRNRLINGGMGIDQRNTGAAQTITAAAALAYTVDRWYAYCTGANVTGQRVAGSNAAQYRYLFTGAASVTKIGFAQRIEAANIYDLNGQTVTLSADLANSLLTTVTWVARYPTTTADTFGTLASPTTTQIATGTFTVTSTVTRYSTQISLPAGATKGVEIEFSVAAQTSGTWTIGNVQLEAGSVASAFEIRPYGLEFGLCQRYYQRYTGYVTNGDAFFGLVINGTECLFLINFPTMRDKPNATTVATNWRAGTATGAGQGSSGVFTINSTQSLKYDLTTAANSGTAGQAAFLQAYNTNASLELLAEIP